MCTRDYCNSKLILARVRILETMVTCTYSSTPCTVHGTPASQQEQQLRLINVFSTWWPLVANFLVFFSFLLFCVLCVFSPKCKLS